MFLWIQFLPNVFPIFRRALLGGYAQRVIRSVSYLLISGAQRYSDEPSYRTGDRFFRAAELYLYIPAI